MIGTDTATPSEVQAPAVDLIPQQLHGCRFVLVRDRDKRAFEKGWNTTQNYAYDSERLARHIAAETNYGVMVDGGLCVLDCDNVIALYEDPFISDVLMQTFAVETGRKGTVGAHFYFYCPDLPAEKYPLVKEDGSDLGDLRGSGSPFYVVGPGSRHPSGNTYKVTTDVEPLTVPLEEVQAFIDRYTPVKKGDIPPREKAGELPGKAPPESIGETAGVSIADRLGLKVVDFLMPNNPQPRDHQIEGAHPVHGSTTGTNLIIDPVANTWYCRAHTSGGGALEALAVREGIIDCSQARPGCLVEHWPAIFDALKKRGYADQLAEMDRKRNTAKGETNPPAYTPAYNPTDAGNSERLLSRYGDDIRYCKIFRKWYVWNGKYWEPDNTDRMLCLATETARKIYEEAQSNRDSTQMARWGIKSESLTSRKNMIEGAGPYVPILPKELDARPMLLNCKNGTLDLENMTFREHRREDFLTFTLNTEYLPDKKCPLWEQHITRILNGDTDLIRCFQEMCGYSLIEGNPEQVLFILHGNGKNGKSVTVSVISKILGEYAGNLEAKSLMQQRRDGPRNDLARVHNKRLVTTSEPGEGMALDESVIKSLTGGSDKVTVRFLYQEQFDFIPGFVIWMSTNHQPEITGNDEGIRRRPWLVPFSYTIPEEQRIPDYDKQLLNEAPGVLNWCLDGLKRYLARGRLNPPEAILVATQQYLRDNDTIGTFLDELYDVDPNGKGDLFIQSRGVVRGVYESWCKEQGIEPVPARKFADYLKAKGIRAGPRNNSGRSWQGLKTKAWNMGRSCL